MLVAAQAEFAEYGCAEAKVDRIAERAELTRGAVYSNFAGKRELYLAVLADIAGRSWVAAQPPATVPRLGRPGPGRVHPRLAGKTPLRGQ